MIFDDTSVAYQLLGMFDNDEVFEIRLLNAVLKSQPSARPKVVLGYFTLARLGDPLVRQLKEEVLQAKGCYVTLNPIQKSALARSQNAFCFGDTRGMGCRDEDVAYRKFILIDADPKRKAGLSSTDEERDFSRRKIAEVMAYLEVVGFPKPRFVAMTGNGYNALYRIYLPNDDNSTDLIKKFLGSLSSKFSDQNVEIDVANYNAARITKLYGTVARKGKASTEHPHRQSEIVINNKDAEIVDDGLIYKVVADCPVTTASDTIPLDSQSSLPVKSVKSVKSSPISSRYIIDNQSSFDLDEWIAEHNISVHYQDQKGELDYYYVDCPNIAQHSDDTGLQQSSIIRLTDGQPRFKCLHHHCVDITWKDYRKHYDPQYVIDEEKRAEEERKANERQFGTRASDRTVKSGVNDDPWTATDFKKKVYRLDDLMKMPVKKPEWVIEDFMSRNTLCLLASAPKIGKSCFVMQLAMAVANGTKFLDTYQATKGNVLLLALEETIDGLVTRVRTQCGDKAILAPNLCCVTQENPWALLNRGGVEDLRSYIRENKCDLVIVDVYEKIKSDSEQRGSGTLYNVEYSQATVLKQLCIDEKVTILIVHHTRKPTRVGFETNVSSEFDDISGSTGLRAAPDTNYMIKVAALEPEKLFVLYFEGRTFNAPPSLVLTHTPENNWKVIPGDLKEVLEEKIKEILKEVFVYAGGTLLKEKTVMGILHGKYGVNMDGDRLAWLLFELKRDGVIQENNNKWSIANGFFNSENSEKEKREKKIKPSDLISVEGPLSNSTVFDSDDALFADLDLS